MNDQWNIEDRDVINSDNKKSYKNIGVHRNEVNLLQLEELKYFKIFLILQKYLICINPVSCKRNLKNEVIRVI